MASCVGNIRTKTYQDLVINFLSYGRKYRGCFRTQCDRSQSLIACCRSVGPDNAELSLRAFRGYSPRDQVY